MRYLSPGLIVLLLVACTAAQPSFPTATPIALPTLQPGGMLHRSLPAAEATEVAPVLVLNNWIVDAQTGAAVQADVYIVESADYREPLAGERVITTTMHYELTLARPLDGWLIVKAPGYETWFVRLQYHILSSRELSGPVELTPLDTAGASA